ncbi:MAG: glycoside hydrolase family 16 protein [Paludibacteraceae bacterium]|nr:glycoside hydrolase family 16 protein [Paludibacteraceae bacterium]
MIKRLLIIVPLLLSVFHTNAEYRLVWSDEFDSFNSDVWNHDIGWGNYGWGNNEQEYYTSNPENIFVEDSKLNIVALRSDAHKNVSDRILYTSAKIHTQQNVSMKYGKIEARIQLPERGQGVWPAFWMLGENQEKGWPYCGEIDICEWRGAEPNSVVSTMHWNGTNGDYLHCDYGQTLKYSRGFDEDYFVYGVEWTPKKAEYYVIDEKDGSRHNINVMDISKATEENGLSCFHQAQYIILNLAMGGQFGGDVDGTIPSRTMKVDWIRVYQDNESYPESKLYNNAGAQAYGYDSNCNLLKDKHISTTYFFAPGWNELSASIDGDTKKLDISLPEQTYERWQAQFSFRAEDVMVEADEEYDLSFVVESSVALKNVLFKIYDGEDDASFMPASDMQLLNIPANEKRTIVRGKMRSPKSMDGVKMLFDFGANPAANITVSDIVLRRSDCDATNVGNVENESYKVRSAGGCVVVNASAAGVVEIYSVDGKCIVKATLGEGENCIHVDTEGYYIVKNVSEGRLTNVGALTNAKK